MHSDIPEKHGKLFFPEAFNKLEIARLRVQVMLLGLLAGVSYGIMAIIIVLRSK